MWDLLGNSSRGDSVPRLELDPGATCKRTADREGFWDGLGLEPHYRGHVTRHIVHCCPMLSAYQVLSMNLNFIDEF